ncbi:type II toxin-antitoxin system VapC family toxin [Jiangella asiatica]|uniref:Type II toxin-antitoxin system VapC family toxin n=1 Tax=Jiangella asiatica TaxID=2530372 RepID=A0A4R5CM25_9ACTN|nr:type II toxin-antitoxin system VapC family toxin [Jiangella asiatica]TDE00270.1 type II toxin-antitoxin system VapC family toxin [Jiangella asiatica]
MTARARLLLDTHVVLWWLADDPTLADDLKAAIDEELEVYVSAVTGWEVAIKQSIGKLTSPVDLAEEIRDSDLHQLPVRFDHAIEAGRLPPHHRDPFDRMLVAQARVERLTLVSRDTAIHGYDVPVLKA